MSTCPDRPVVNAPCVSTTQSQSQSRRSLTTCGAMAIVGEKDLVKVEVMEGRDSARAVLIMTPVKIEPLNALTLAAAS